MPGEAIAEPAFLVSSLVLTSGTVSATALVTAMTTVSSVHSLVCHTNQHKRYHTGLLFLKALHMPWCNVHNTRAVDMHLCSAKTGM